MPVREPEATDGQAALAGLRVYTRWSLAATAAAAVLLPAPMLLQDDRAPVARLVAAVVLAAVGWEAWRLVDHGMAGLGRQRAVSARSLAAALGALGLWVAMSPWIEPAPVFWALPLGMVAGGIAIGVGPRAREVVLPSACLLTGATGVLAAWATAGGASAATLGFGGALTVAILEVTVVVQVWMWDVMLRLDAARGAAAEVAVLRERLRFAGELHDVQGHHLQAIALKAELARRLVGVDDEAARGHAADVQELARTALADTRALVQGYRRTDLATELENAVGILRAAGVEATVTGSPAEIPTELQALFGSLIREAATNLLRHSEAGQCTISVVREPDAVVVRVADDGSPRGAPDLDGTGIAGLRERFAAAGGLLDAAPRSERGFALSGRAPIAARAQP